MIVVVDASAAYALLTEARYAEAIRQVDDLFAPDLIVSELLNTLWKIGRSGRATPPLNTALDLLERLHIVSTLPFAEAAATLAQRLDHPVYGCTYIAVARHHHGKLLTCDRRLTDKLKSSGFTRLLL